MLMLREVFMGLISGILGNASEADIVKIQKEFGQVLANGEEIKRVYKYLRDYFVFTNVRLVLVEKKDVWGQKITYHTIPYSRILQFSIETAGPLNLDNELKIYVAGMDNPVAIKFQRFLDIYELQTAVADFVM
jgi:hypothetical protein